MSESTARPLTGRPPGATQISSRLVSLAILKENWNQGQTYLDNFVPFVVECLRNASSAVTSADVQEGLRSKFRIRVPQGVVETLLHKTVKRGYAYREDNAYTPLPEMLSEVELMAPRQHELLRTYEALSKEMLAFAKERFALDVSEAEVSDALDAYVADFGAETILHGCTAEVELRALPEPGLDYVAHSFVENLSRTNPTFFGYFQTLVEGSMLASIVYLPNVESTEQRFRDSTTIYLDTPFVLKALGFVGPEQRAPAVELIELLRESKATVACFEATIEEVRGVVVASMPPAGGGVNAGTGEVARYFRQTGLRRADLQLLADKLERSLAHLDVKVRSAPRFSVDWSVDEKALDAVLHERVGYMRPNARRHDLDALTAIHRLREGRRPPMLENARAIFLTTNSSLVAASREFFQGEAEDANHAWPHAMLDTSLATLVWLKQPQRAPDLPRKQILADCYAALHPGERMWNRWLVEIQRIADTGDYSDEDLAIMRFSPDAQRALMDVTMGEETAIDERTVPQVLASAAETITAPMRAELASHAEALERSEQARLAAEARANDAEVAAEAARQMVKEDRQQRHQRLHDHAEHLAKKVARVIRWGLIAAVGISSMWTIVGFLAPGVTTPLWVAAILVVTLIVGAIGLFVHFVAGWSSKQIAQSVEAWIANRLHRRSLRRLGEDDRLDAE